MPFAVLVVIEIGLRKIEVAIVGRCVARKMVGQRGTIKGARQPSKQPLERVERIDPGVGKQARLPTQGRRFLKVRHTRQRPAGGLTLVAADYFLEHFGARAEEDSAWGHGQGRSDAAASGP